MKVKFRLVYKSKLKQAIFTPNQVLSKFIKMIDFDWFVFRTISLDEFTLNFRINISQAQDWYSWWSEEYNHLAHRFYIEQYDRHTIREFREFCRANSLEARYPDDLSDIAGSEQLYETWKGWIEESESLQQHRQTVENLLEDHKNPRRSFSLRDLTRMDELFKSSGWTGEKIMATKKLWFNLNIEQPSTDDLAQRKSMPYPQYLKTSHWRKVKAAMLLIEQAKCLVCGDSADSFYGGDWETDAHVHHLHYRNLGYERYEDIQLLCKEHHLDAHGI